MYLLMPRERESIKDEKKQYKKKKCNVITESRGLHEPKPEDSVEHDNV